MLLDLQAGIEHLCSKLNEIRVEKPGEAAAPIETVTQQNLVDNLELARQKMKVLIKDMK